MKIIEFSVSNYKSIRDKVTLSMVAAPYKEHPNHIFEGAGYRLLKTALIYGQNGSGKSTVLRALRYAVDALSGVVSSENDDAHLFSEDTKNKETQIILDFVSGDNLKYSFSFSYLKDHILSEKLSYYPKKREVLLYERNDKKINFGNSFFGDKQEIRSNLSTKKLLFTVAGDDGERCNNSVYNLFQEVCRKSFSKKNSTVNDFLNNKIFQSIKDDDNLKKWIESLLRAADFGVDSFDFKMVKMVTKDGANEKVVEDEVALAIFNHKSLSVENKLPSFFESQGTQELFSNSDYIYNSLVYGCPLFLDDDKVTLHTDLKKFIIQLFQDERTNPNNAQLFYVTHDTAAMVPDMIRRDEVWFVEKKDGMATTLYSLADFNKIKSGRMLSLTECILMVPLVQCPKSA
jgi:AAA15 family ATPase/GTPase